ncbi:hypothetical protein [Actinospongicola halichondriae]|uniref:hypothetical protein n=1 Tax=Actinospongicola halichondriae TaxID=3236844 RepID=UPI003D3D4A74
MAWPVLQAPTTKTVAVAVIANLDARAAPFLNRSFPTLVDIISGAPYSAFDTVSNTLSNRVLKSCAKGVTNDANHHTAPTVDHTWCNA